VSVAADANNKPNSIRIMKTFEEAVNWEYVHAHNPAADGPVEPGPWARKIIEHAKERGFDGEISEEEACEIINLYLW
jgi:hypothetical protein